MSTGLYAPVPGVVTLVYGQYGLGIACFGLFAWSAWFYKRHWGKQR